MLKSCGLTREIINKIPIINEITENDNEEKTLLKRMKEDELYLKELYLSSNICEEEWVKEYRDIGKKFQEYEYKGNDNGIKTLLENYKIYGQKIEDIALTINKSNYEKGIEELEGLKEAARKCEEELSTLYNEYY